MELNAAGASTYLLLLTTVFLLTAAARATTPGVRVLGGVVLGGMLASVASVRDETGLAALSVLARGNGMEVLLRPDSGGLVRIHEGGDVWAIGEAACAGIGVARWRSEGCRVKREPQPMKCFGAEGSTPFVRPMEASAMAQAEGVPLAGFALGDARALTGARVRAYRNSGYVEWAADGSVTATRWGLEDDEVIPWAEDFTVFDDSDDPFEVY